MKRRCFLVGLSSALTGSLPSATAQQKRAVRTVGVLVGYSEKDQKAQTWIQALVTKLEELGWKFGVDVRYEVRWAAGDAGLRRSFAKELVALNPDVIVGGATPEVAALLKESTTIPVVFTSSADPVGSGFAASFAKPGGNATGFSQNQSSLASKWLDLLVQVSPSIKHVGVMFNPDMTAGRGEYFLSSMREFSSARRILVIPLPATSLADIDNIAAMLGQKEGAGLCVLPDPFTISSRDHIISSVAHRRIPAIYPYDIFTKAGGLISYGIDLLETYRLGATYVDRILRGAKPADLPIQAPTKFELIINNNTARNLGLEIPTSLAMSADESID